MSAPAILEKQELYNTRLTELNTIFEEARDGERFDLSRTKVLEKLGAKDSAHAMELLKNRRRELDDLGGQLQQAQIKEMESLTRSTDAALRAPITDVRHPKADALGAKTWGQMFVESKEFKESVRSKRDVPFALDGLGIKTLFQTSAGFAPESVRSGLLVEGATRPVQILDLIPTFPITQASFVYMEETTRTHSSAEKAEGAAYAESAFAWTQKTSAVQKITDSIPVTDEQLEDEAQVRSLLEQRLSFGLRQRLDGQILVGDGSSPNLRGILNVVGIQTQAKASDPAIVAFMKALTKVRVTGRASPNGAVFHPTNWQDVILTQDAEGRFLFGNPFQGPGPQQLFGIPVAQSDAITLGTAIVCDFANFTRIDDRRGVMIQTGYVGSQFTEGKVTLRGDLRAAFTVTRPAAVCSITGL